MFKIYTQAEADDLGLKYVPWRKAKKGDWGLTDDGYVGECLKINGPYTSNKNLKLTKQEFVFSFARVWSNKDIHLSYEERKVHRSYSRMSTKHWAESEVKSKRAKRFILAYVMMFMAGGGIDWEKLGIIFRPSNATNDPGRRAKYLFKQKAFKRMIQNRMIEVFRNKKVTEGDVIDMYKEAYDLAKRTKNPREMRKVAGDFRDLLDMLPQKVQKGFRPFDEEDIEEAEYGDLNETLEAARAELPPQVPAIPIE